MNKANFFVLSGPPGAGKSSLLTVLSRTYPVVEEPARRVLVTERQRQGDATGEQNAALFVRRMAELAQADYCSAPAAPITFFDRGLPDLLGYLAYYQLPPSALRLKAQQYRYNRIVFWLPSWRAIYRQDSERRLTFSGAYRFGCYLKTAYRQLGYRLIEVPRGPLQHRADFIADRALSIIHLRRQGCGDGGSATSHHADRIEPPRGARNLYI